MNSVLIVSESPSWCRGNKKMTALRLRLQKELFDVTEEQLVSVI